ncbi:MAG: hypothetical protein Q9182_001830 [Xanthomendoza sp. 2 TL-2023]
MSAKDRELHATEATRNVPIALQKRASLLGIPFELRSQILEECLPDSESVNLSRLAPLRDRATWGWTDGSQSRCDPAILSASKQLYEDASRILYRRNFIIEVNCEERRKENAEPDYDPNWSVSNLGGRFPFNKAKRITFRLGAYDSSEIDHIFHHMVYICGLLSSEGNGLQELRVELLCSEVNGPLKLRVDPNTMKFQVEYGLDENCTSWRDSDRVRFSETCGLTGDFEDQMAFYLQPLALLGRVRDCKIAFSGGVEPSEKLKRVFQHYENALVNQARTSCGEPRWIRLEYTSIMVKHKQRHRHKQLEKIEKHEACLGSTYKGDKSKHSVSSTRYPFWVQAKCDGCDRWLLWLTPGCQCGLRACASCRAELKLKRCALGEVE